MMRFVRAVAVSLLGLLLIALAAGCGRSASSVGAPPRLIVDASVADDLQALALETWARFLDAFAGRTACFGDVVLSASFDLADRAAYDPRTATVTVHVPATAAMLQSALIHEWAHHVEHQCAAHRELRAAFLAAQGLPADTPWRLDDAGIAGQEDGAAWAATPSEQYAEAAVEVVLGHRPIPTAARVS
ncbi:MAG: hypothetical protein WHX53_03815, partial [Anaerolineae bacterium]